MVWSLAFLKNSTTCTKYTWCGLAVHIVLESLDSWPHWYHWSVGIDFAALDLPPPPAALHTEPDIQVPENLLARLGMPPGRHHEFLHRFAHVLSHIGLKPDCQVALTAVTKLRSSIRTSNLEYNLSWFNGDLPFKKHVSLLGNNTPDMSSNIPVNQA